MVEIELLSVAGCPHVDAARKLLRECVEELHVRAQIEEKVGAYPSPTIRVDGEDVMGSPPFAEAACRLDTPTRERILAALAETEALMQTTDKSLRADRSLQVGA